jgi:hypothetical protein
MGEAREELRRQFIMGGLEAQDAIEASKLRMLLLSSLLVGANDTIRPQLKYASQMAFFDAIQGIFPYENFDSARPQPPQEQAPTGGAVSPTEPPPAADPGLEEKRLKFIEDYKKIYAPAH